MEKVVVVGDDKNNIIIQSSNNPQYGGIRVLQVTRQKDSKGFLKTIKRYAFINALMEELLKLNCKVGQEIDGKIVIIESLIPFNTEDPDKHLKVAGSTGVVFTLNNQPIYKKTYFTQEMDEKDQFIMHDNNDEIKRAFKSQKISKFLNARINRENLVL